jgi:uncharacterized protein (UPF0212 family)
VVAGVGIKMLLPKYRYVSLEIMLDNCTPCPEMIRMPFKVAPILLVKAI